MIGSEGEQQPVHRVSLRKKNEWYFLGEQTIAMSVVMRFNAKMNIGIRWGTGWEEQAWRDLYMVAALHVFMMRRHMSIDVDEIGYYFFYLKNIVQFFFH